MCASAEAAVDPVTKAKFEQEQHQWLLRAELAKTGAAFRFILQIHGQQLRQCFGRNQLSDDRICHRQANDDCRHARRRAVYDRRADAQG